jgi:hypothetical protein
MTLVGIIRGSPFKNQHWWLGIVGQFDVEEALRRHLATRLAGSPPQHQIDPLRGWAAPALQLKGLCKIGQDGRFSSPELGLRCYANER